MSTAVQRAELAMAEWRTVPYEELNLEVCQCILTETQKAKETLKLIKKRLASNNANVQMLALTLLETLSNYCGDVVHREILEVGILDELVKVVKKTPDMRVKEKILIMIYNWQCAFGGPTARYPHYFAAYQQLRNAGLEYLPRYENTTPSIRNYETQPPVINTTPLFANSQTQPVYINRGPNSQTQPVYINPGPNPQTQPIFINPGGYLARPLVVNADSWLRTPQRTIVIGGQPSQPTPQTQLGVYTSNSVIQPVTTVQLQDAQATYNLQRIPSQNLQRIPSQINFSPDGVSQSSPPAEPPMSTTDIQRARAMAGILHDMLNAVNHTNPQLEDECLVEIVGNCSDYQMRIEQLVNDTGDEGLLREALEVNDQLLRVLQRYENIRKGLAPADPATKVPVVLDANPQGASAAASPSSRDAAHNRNEQSDDRSSATDGRAATVTRPSNSSSPFLRKVERSLQGSPKSSPRHTKYPIGRSASSNMRSLLPGQSSASSPKEEPISPSRTAPLLGASTRSLPRPPWDIQLPEDMTQPSSTARRTGLWQQLFEQQQTTRSWVLGADHSRLTA